MITQSDTYELYTFISFRICVSNMVKYVPLVNTSTAYHLNSRIFIRTYELESYPKKKEKEKAFINYSCDGRWTKKTNKKNNLKCVMLWVL